jgi:protein gp37
VSDKSSIQWTESTWNPTRGCTKIAQGCKNCYAATFAERFRGVPGHPYELGFDPRTAPDKLTEPLKWKKPRRIFVDSMSDVFHEAFSFEYIAAVFGIMAACPRHTFQILTKRPERAVEFFTWLTAEAEGGWAFYADPRRPEHAHENVVCMEYLGRSIVPDGRGGLAFMRDVSPGWPLPNVWIGTSIANQPDADRNIRHLLRIPAAVRFVSAEPLLGPVDFDAVDPGRSFYPTLDWVIVGGESGPGARPCNVEWIRSIVAQCRAADVPVFVKQLGAKPILPMDGESWFDGRNFHDGAVMLRPRDKKGGDMAEWPTDLRIREYPAGGSR